MTPKTSSLPFFLLLLSCLISYIILHFIYGIFYQAYLWDELGVYSRAAIHLYENNISLLPNAIPDELSRGHPNLCAFYYAVWFRIFDCSPFVGHIAAACLYLLSISFAFLIAKKYLNNWSAAIISFVLFLNPFFLAQSILILPESMLMLATLAALYFYLNENFGLTSVCLILALQIKESAIVLPIAFTLSYIWHHKSFNFKSFIWLFLLPIISFVIFLIIQKVQRNYFFYPLHTSLLQFDLYYIKERWNELIKMFLIYPSFLFLLILFIPSIKLSSIRNNEITFVFIILGGVGFTLFNYYLDRYTLFYMMPFCLGILIYLNIKYRSYLYYVLIVYAGLNFLVFEGYNQFKDTDFSYTYHISNVQDLLKELDKPEYSKTTIRVNFPLAAAYWGNKNGYTRKADYTLSFNQNDSADFVVFTEPGNAKDSIQLLLHQTYKSYKVVKNKKAYSVIYKRITQ